MDRWNDRYRIPGVQQTDLIAGGDWCWIEFQVVSVSRNDANIDDMFDESSEYVRHVTRQRCQARVYKPPGWDRRRLVASGLAVREGDIIVSDIPSEYKDYFAPNSLITVYRPDMTSMNDAMVIDVYPSDPLESCWLLVARRTT